MSSNGQVTKSKKGRDRRHISKLFEKLPPHSLECEMALLGCLFLDPSIVKEIGDALQPDDFYDPKNGLVFKHVRDYVRVHETVDIVLITNLLASRSEFDDTLRASYLIELANSVPDTRNWQHYLREVKRNAMVRELIELCGDCAAHLYERQDNMERVADRIIERVESIKRKHSQETSDE